MNKKFSTLVASLLLATTVGTGYAQDALTKATAPLMEAVTQVTDGRAYQLSDGYNVLVMQKVSDGRGGYNYELAFIPYMYANVGESLWTVRKVSQDNGIAFQFVNVAYNYPLSYDPAQAQDYDGAWTASKLGKGVATWSWMRSEAGNDLTIARTPENYFTSDSVMTLVPTAEGKIAAVKYATKEVSGKVDALPIKPVVAGPVWLNEFDLNTKLQSQKEGKTAFKFEKGVSEGLPNEWVEREYKAVLPVGQNTLSYGETQDAKDQADDAYAKYLAAKEISDAWGEKVGESNAEIKAINDQLNAVLSEELTVNQEYNKVNQDWKSTTRYENYLKDEIISLRRAIIFNSHESEEFKAEYEKLLKAEAQAEADYYTAIETYNSLNEELTALTQAEADAYIAKNQALAEQENAKEVDNNYIQHFSNSLVGNLSDYRYWLSDYSSTPEQKADAWNTLFNHAKATTDEDKAQVVEYVHSLYTYLVEEKGFAPNVNVEDLTGIKEAVDEYRTKVLSDAKQAYETATLEAAEATGAREQQQTLVNEAATERGVKGDAYEKAYYAREAAEKDWDESSAVVKDLVAERNRLLKEVKEVQDKVAKLSDEKTSYEQQIIALNQQAIDLNKQLASVKYVKKFIVYKWLTKLNQTNAIARTYDHLCAVWFHLLQTNNTHWLSLQTDDNKYLMVDTAYVNNNQEVAGNNHLTFNIAKHDADFVNPNAPLAARDINGRFNFRFFYYPTHDSLRIEADGYNQKDVTTKDWADRTDSEIRYRSSYAPGFEQNLVKVAVLGNHREVTVGSSEYVKLPTNIFHYTINDRIGLDIVPAQHPVNVEAGLYYMDVINSKEAQENNARLMLDLDGETLTKIAPAEFVNKDFAHMPAAKWVVEVSPTDFGGYPNIFNQETEQPLNNYAYTVTTRNDSTIVTITYDYQDQEITNDFLLTPAPASTEGYYHGTPEAREVFTLNYLSAAGNLNVTIGNDAITENDSILAVANDDATTFRLKLVGMRTYGEADSLKRGIYKIQVNEANKMTLKNRFIRVSKVNGTEMLVASKTEKNATPFFLKEINDVNGTHYYALIDTLATVKAGVIEDSGLIKAENLMAETRTSAFALIADTTRYYREFTAEELGDNYNMKFYRTSSTEKEYLYADATENGMTFLSVEGKGDNVGTAAELTVIPTTEEGVLMPQYFIARNVTEKAGSVDWCGEEHEALADSLACPHTTVIPDTLVGEFLVNLKIDEELNKNNLWENKYTRLAFLKGFAVKPEGTMPGEGQYTTLIIGEDTVAFDENKHNPAKFEFRLINDDPAQDFLIESESWGYNKDKKAILPFEGGVRPMVKGGWLKVQNGVPVIVADGFEYASQADVYNVDTNYTPTANEEISANAVVSVVATDGAVIVKGAEGKNVIVSTILGKVVANEVLNSDNETIAAPAGIVVVSVDGESFKVAVK